MSKIALTPDASGTGVFTIASPATNTDRTLTLPDEAGTVLTSASSLASANLTGAVTVSGANVGIGTTSPDTLMELVSLHPTLTVRDSDSTTSTALATLRLAESGASDALGSYWDITAKDAAWQLAFTHSSAGEAMRINSSGDVLVGTLNVDPSFGTTAGSSLQSSGQTHHSSTGTSLILNRTASDGTIAQFRKAGTTVGSIGVDNSDNLVIEGNSGHSGIQFGTNALLPHKNGAVADNLIDLGSITERFDDIYATNGTIQTSDRTEKQDIDVMSEAETRVAAACKGLIRKFRWIDAVAEKGDDARIHFGIIAQDLQDAFAAEGLDASRYAMFCSDTWWETQTDVPAVEAVAEVLDEEGNLVTEAVEAKEAYTRTDHYDTLEKAPEGATERTRLGVRYSELLAFIIGAL